MAGIRKTPTLREKSVNGTTYFTSEIWRPDGKRTTVSFGRADAQHAGDVHIAFGKWLKLFKANPHKTLSYKSPFAAVGLMDEPGSIVGVGDFSRQYRRWAETTFKFTRNGDINPHYQRLVLAQKFLEPYNDWPVGSFGPDEYRKVQDAMVAYRYKTSGRVKESTDQGDDGAGRRNGGGAEKSLTRYSINQHMHELRRMWVWGVGRGVVTHAQEQLLHEVRNLRRGHKGTTEGKTRPAITPEEFASVLAAASSTIIADMMKCMWYAEFRPSEVCNMRAIEFDKKHEDCWLFVPGRDRHELGEHKTMEHEMPRAIPITAKLQVVLGPRIETCKHITDYLFSPKLATQEMVERRFTNRMTPLVLGNRSGTNRVEHPMIKQPRDHYDNESFCKAVKHACRRARVEPYFTPYDIRRTAITRIRSISGSKEIAALLTGHTDIATTDIYLLDEVQEAMKAAKEIDGKLG